MNPFNRKNILILVLITLFGLLLSACGSGGTALTYRVDGTAADAHITYLDASGNMQDKVVDLPWETSIDFSDDFNFEIVVMNEKADGDVNCAVLMDDEEIGNGKSFAYVRCSGSVSKSGNSTSHTFSSFSVETYLNNAVDEREAGNFEAALAEAEKALDLAPYYSEPYFVQGVIYHQMEDWEQSLAAFDNTIEREPNDKGAFVNRGLSHSKLGNADLAIADWTTALEIDPEYVLAYFNRAISYYNLGDYEAAKADVLKVQELSDDPDKISWAEDVLGLLESKADTPVEEEPEVEELQPTEALAEYLEWRDVVFAVTSDQVDISTDNPNQVYGVIMDVGLSDDFIISITAFPTGESSLRTTVGGGVIGLGGDEFIAEHAKNIVILAQSLSERATQINNHNLPNSQAVYFYFLTPSGLMLSEASLTEITAQSHPLYEIFVQFSEIKARSEELQDTYSD
ncbi:MAG: tetratricopeptide repeat protein [Chloroflexota bacterium]|nr:tetratricopeptide repeat protein [Chloroflexota bacterium]